jgi:hypothetical protein
LNAIRTGYTWEYFFCHSLYTRPDIGILIYKKNIGYWIAKSFVYEYDADYRDF